MKPKHVLTPKQLKKKLYNNTYSLRKQGFPVNTKRKEIEIYFDQVTEIAINTKALEMIMVFNYKLIENRQLKMKF